MPKLESARVPKYSKHKASGQAVVTLAGRDHYLGRYGTKASRAEYDRLIAEWLAAGRPQQPAKETDLTVAELALAYQRHAQTYYRKASGRPTKTVNVVKAAMLKLTDIYSDLLALEFGPRHLKTVQQAMIRAGAARSYINDVSAVIKRMFKWAVAEEFLPITVYQTLAVVPGLRQGRTEARETEPRRPVDDAVVDATLAKLPGVVADMVRVQRLTGMRPGEVCLLRPCDVDRTADVWLFTPSEHKTEHHGQRRIVAIGPQAQTVLRPYLLRPADAYCFSPADSERKRREARHAERKTPLAYGNRPGSNRKAKPRRTPRDRYDKDSYARAIARACRLADVPPWSPNQLRHAFATAVRRQCGLEASQVALGHRRADVTQIYAERDVRAAADVARQLG